MTLAPGSMVNPSVRLLRPLGEGAMGSVWLAQHLALKTEVAVKFIHGPLAAEHPELLKRFEQEASVAARIRSPHVVQTFDHGLMEGKRPYIVMELLEGESLDSMLMRCGPLPVATVAQILVQVARALGKAHKLGIVHRDIKPDNIFITHGEDGIFCKVLDFGIAKETQLPKMGGLTSADVLIGTPEYMSPEQVMTGKEVDFRADLWALGITTYHLLTGQLPFTGQAIGSLVVKLLNARFQPASELRADLPPGADAWFARAMHRDPAQRFQSGREMAREFVRQVVGQPALLDELGVEDLSGPQMGPAGQGTLVQAGVAPGTLSGSSSNLTPSRVRRRRLASRAAAVVGVVVLSVALVVAIVTWPGSDAATPSTPAEERPVPAAPPETQAASSQPTEPSAHPSASSAPTEEPHAQPAQHKGRIAPPPPSAPVPSGKGRKDHGF